MIKQILLMAVLNCFILFPLFGQKKITGKVTDQNGKPVESVTIVCKDSAKNIVTFTRTDAKGEFAIITKNESAFYSLEISSIGYKKTILKISDPDKKQQIKLDPDEIQLKTVVVKTRPSIKVNRDTLVYKPSEFAEKQDRSIGDVLKKMPGIEVNDEGKIKYNGTAISNFYIDGDNILDDRYNIGSKSIPYIAVENVQVIQNDQPIKMLRKNNLSEDVALNIIIKDDARLKTMGEITEGAGLPSKYYENVTAMLFKKNLKFINNLKADNTGVDPGIDLISHNLVSYLKQVENKKPDNFLSVGATGVPILPQERTLFLFYALFKNLL